MQFSFEAERLKDAKARIDTFVHSDLLPEWPRGFCGWATLQQMLPKKDSAEQLPDL
jgi:hypothetical protein